MDAACLSEVSGGGQIDYEANGSKCIWGIQITTHDYTGLNPAVPARYPAHSAYYSK